MAAGKFICLKSKYKIDINMQKIKICSTYARLQENQFFAARARSKYLKVAAGFG